MNITARKVIARLQEEKSAVLSDATPKKEDNLDLSKVDDNTPPSEFKKLSEALKIKRLNAPGISDVELDGLMRRIGKR